MRANSYFTRKNGSPSESSFKSLYFLFTIIVLAVYGCKHYPTSHSNGSSPSSVYETKQALPADVAANAIGVNTHLNYSGSIYDVHYADIIKPKLAEFGIRHIRDHFGDAVVNARFQELATGHGIKLLLINQDAGSSLVPARQEVKRLNAINPDNPVVEYIEPSNERDNGWKKPDGTSDWVRLCRYMQEYYQTFKQDPATANIPLLGPSFARTRHSAVNFGEACKPATGLMDMGNTHIYSGLYPESPLAGGWGMSLDQAISNYKKTSGDKLIIDTETGYKMSSGQMGHPAVSQPTAAKYSPRLVLSRIQKGFDKVYFYQLINNSEDFGLLNNDGSPRLQFTALKNFIQLLADPGKKFTPGSLSYFLEGDLTGIHQLLFQRRDGTFMLVLWQGINGSSGGTKDNDYTDINNSEKTIILNLKNKASVIRLYRPSFNAMPDGNGTTPVATFRRTSTAVIAVPDHIVVVEIVK